MRARDSNSGGALDTAPRIWGKYRFSARIEAGEQRLLYRGVEVATGRQVTVEVLAKPALDDRFDERLNRAVELFARTRSEQLVPIYEHGVTQDGTRFVAMAPLLGQSLEARLKARRRLPVAEAVSIACRVAEAIGAIHERQAAYGALEPSRVFLVPDGAGGHRVRLLFGVSRAPTVTTATLSGSISDQRSGTYLSGGDAYYGYSSPEQLTRPPSGASDVFAVGALTYAMIAGVPPFARESTSRERAPLEPLSSRVRDVTIAPAIDRVLARALAFEPENRQRSLQELAGDLKSALGAGASRPAAAGEHVGSGVPRSLRGPQGPIGSTIAGKYRLHSQLAADSGETIFRAVELESGAAVNVSVFTGTDDAEREIDERLAGADRLGDGGAGRVIAVLDRGRLGDGSFYIVSDPWQETLADRLRRERTMLPAIAVAMIAEIAEALDCMHARGQVHRELSPANVVFAEEDPAKPKLRLVNPPRRKSIEPASPNDVPAALLPAARNLHAIFGAPSYASPEEVSSGFIGIRSNVYSLGAIAYELLTGSAPFAEASTMQLLLRHVTSAVEPPSRCAPQAGIPAEWDEPILRALAKHASSRFVSAGDFAEELACALESAPPPAEPLGSDPQATEASVVVPLVRTLSQPSASEPSVVVPLTRLAGARSERSVAAAEPDADFAEQALPLLRPAAIPLINQRPAAEGTAGEAAASIKVVMLLIALAALAAGLWTVARHLL